MKRKNLSKFVALAMAGAMLISPLPVSAAEVDSEDAAQGSTTGTGNVEGIVNKDVFKVELPTVPADSDTTFNFILDPQGLITATNGTAHTNATFDPDAKGLYFANAQADGSTNYTASSPSLTAKNKGTVDVDVTLTAAANDLTDATNNTYSIGLAADDTFAGDKTTSIYLALVSGSQTAALTEEGATITDTLAAAPDDAYEVTYNSTDSKYEYGLTTAALAADYAGFDSLDFNLTGACNTAADWAAAESAAPSVDVAWALERHSDAPTFTAGTSIGSIQYTKGSGKIALDKIASIKCTYNGKVYDGYNANGSSWAAAKDTGSVITIDSKFMAFFESAGSTEATITYTTVGGETKTATVTLCAVNSAPTFTTGTEIGTINYTVGAGADGLDTIQSIECTYNGKVYDGYNANGSSWAAASDSNGVITLDSKFMSFFESAGSTEGTITYTTVGGETKTATVTISAV